MRVLGWILLVFGFVLVFSIIFAYPGMFFALIGALLLVAANARKPKIIYDPPSDRPRGAAQSMFGR